MSDVEQEARHILNRCGPDTPRADIVWAAGVVVCDQAFHFSSLPILSDRSKMPGWGAALGGRTIDCRRTGLLIAAAYTDIPLVPTVRWEEIAELVTADRIGAVLTGQIGDLLDEQRDRQRMLASPRRPWEQLVAESRALAAMVWRRCRPAAQVQLDLFDLLAGAR